MNIGFKPWAGPFATLSVSPVAQAKLVYKMWNHSSFDEDIFSFDQDWKIRDEGGKVLLQL